MLVSSFLGLGCGVLLARRRLNLYKWFPPALFLLVCFVVVMKGIRFQQGPHELRFLFQTTATPTLLPILIVFVLNTLVFVPLGGLIGSFFQQLAPLRAYAWDIGGAIAGTTVFGLFSYFWFSPIVGCLGVMVIYFVYCRDVRHAIVSGVFFATSVWLMTIGADPWALWSPYNHITIREIPADKGIANTPSSRTAAVKDPPLYVVEVNRDFYMTITTIDSESYTQTTRTVEALIEQYSLPYLIRPNPRDVLVVGAGGGVDVEAALIHGAERVDAVEIDPVIIQLGRQYNPAQSYSNPKVIIHNSDARAFFRQAEVKYDAVIFGFLDSQSLFSQMSNVRLDSFVYTQESFREAFSLLRSGGILSVSFFSGGQGWVVDRLVKMLRHATHAAPLLYFKPSGQVILLVGKDFVPKGPARSTSYRPLQWRTGETPEALDDWPYLYLMHRAIPLDYLFNIGALLATAFLFLWFSSGKAGPAVDVHFFCLGAGFLLLETKSITTISLYFGTTWFVSMVVILGILIMVFLANLVALGFSRFSFLLYAPLFVSLGFLYFFPTQNVLSWPFFLRLTYSLVVIPLPIFFAGLIFSTTFRDATDPSLALGSNLLGAMVGGFAEYLGMIMGMKALLLIVLLFYLSSLWARLRPAQARMSAESSR